MTVASILSLITSSAPAIAKAGGQVVQGVSKAIQAQKEAKAKQQMLIIGGGILAAIAIIFISFKKR